MKYNNLDIIFGTKEINDLISNNRLKPFEKDIINFVSDFSLELLKYNKIKNFPDLVTFAYFFRKSNLNLLKSQYNDIESRFSLGVTLHIAPSNVPVNFLFSLFLALISGNSSIVRLPSRNFDQINISIDILNKIKKSQKHKNIIDKIILVRYPHDDNINRYLSSISDSRMLWGGDKTVTYFKSLLTKPSNIDLSFFNRFSCAVIDSEFIINNSNNLNNYITKFYNDTFLFDQNACTSPRLIFWLGKENLTKKAKSIFFNELIKKINKSNYIIAPSSAVKKLNLISELACKNLIISNEVYGKNQIYSSEINKINNEIFEYDINSGFFVNYNILSIEELNELDCFRLQTLVYLGFKSNYIKNKLKTSNHVFTRIFEVGKSSEFSLIWDGIDVVRSLTKRIEIN
jgi:hypothetical protein